ncbi:MAG: hypothetical protein HZY76_14875 [Anaerolineae bacterium]|nr:MAG: hypothetical protein HZY76_14875 [Anaerolineae bacterium]
MLALALLFLRGDFIMPALAFSLQVNSIVRPYAFDLSTWEIDAIMAKVRDTVRSPVQGISETEQAALVRAYMANVARSRTHTFYRAAGQRGPPTPRNTPATHELEALRRQQAYWRPQVEATIEWQVRTVLHDAGLTTLGAVWPPVRFHFSELPHYLVVSPRKFAVSLGSYLQPDVPIVQMDAIETAVDRAGVAVDQNRGVRALVDDIGGFSTWPTMVLDTTDLRWVLSTVAHEWVHTYLAFYPLGWHYFDNGDATTINETVSSIVGDEVGDLVLQRYYPDLMPPPAIDRPAPTADEDALTPKFDFSRDMRETRQVVDQLLAEGRIDEAESYMEARRQHLLANGYSIRKLNQAYFAFHGSYATGPGAVDPIAQLEQLRAARFPGGLPAHRT